MKRDHSAAMFERIASYAKVWPAVVAWIGRMISGPATYRPAEHYMRGPGPKCREKRTKRET